MYYHMPCFVPCLKTNNAQFFAWSPVTPHTQTRHDPTQELTFIRASITHVIFIPQYIMHAWLA